MFEPLLTLALSMSEDSPRGAAVRAVLPLAVIAAVLLGSLPVYVGKSRRYGAYRDADIEAKGETPLLGLRLRRYFIWLVRPAWGALRQSGLPASAVTTLAALIGLGSGFAFAQGSLALGGWLYLLAGVLDVFDGRLAREYGSAGRAGAVLDSVLDRYVDAASLAGLAWFYRDDWLLLACLLALSGGFFVSYVKARAEGVGVEVRVGLMQRPERVLCLGLGTVTAPLIALLPVAGWRADWLLCIVLVWLAVSTQATAIRRLMFTLGALGWMRRPAWSLRKDGLARAVAVASTATLADFALVNVAMELGWVSDAWVATALGCALGAGVSFTGGRDWAFAHAGERAPVQVGRYLLVSATSMGLNAGGVALVTPLLLDYRVSWLLVRGLVFVLWNFHLHRAYVFQENGGGPAREPLPVAANRSAGWRAGAKHGAAG